LDSSFNDKKLTSGPHLGTAFRLVTKIWPAEAKFVSRPYVRDWTRLAIEEMIASGTTAMQDLYFFPEEIEAVCNELGMRAVIGQCVIEFPTPMAKDGDDYMRLMRERLAAYSKENRNGERLVTIAITPHAPYSVSEEHILEAKALAAEYGCVFHTHLHETEEEISASVNLDKKNGFCHRCDIACRPLSNLHRIGILDSTCSFAHMTQLEPEEIQLLAEKQCHVVHCPSSNMKLASGFCPVAALLEKGVNVALGTDGAASNNSLDMVAEVKLAALLGKGVAKSATAVNAKEALRMATINGAKALGLGNTCGSIEVGKRADLVAVDLSNRNSCRPVYDPVATFVYSAGRECVRSVWIDGNAKLINNVRVNAPIETSEVELRRCAERWQARMEEVVKELNE
jgi:5-methylthioadenosine/S-adenosylhomocysteine deaminase